MTYFTNSDPVTRPGGLAAIAGETRTALETRTFGDGGRIFLGGGGRERSA